MEIHLFIVIFSKKSAAMKWLATTITFKTNMTIMYINQTKKQAKTNIHVFIDVTHNSPLKDRCLKESEMQCTKDIARDRRRCLSIKVIHTRYQSIAQENCG